LGVFLSRRRGWGHEEGGQEILSEPGRDEGGLRHGPGYLHEKLESALLPLLGFDQL
jgi:hypothetical protein